ncbi:Rz1-like lysis system protein LysC [Pantoea dispersa]|uniref:Rz1-like lysis system protein LysC n=1 Tax=Pantoea dispersa TaxID=59814 RepID=UPI003B967863
MEYRAIKQPRLNLPAELTSLIKAPEPANVMSYGDSVELNVVLYGIVGQCNIDRAAIRKIESSDKG